MLINIVIVVSYFLCYFRQETFHSYRKCCLAIRLSPTLSHLKPDQTDTMSSVDASVGWDVSAA